MTDGKIPQKVLICDKDVNAANTLKKILEEKKSIIKAKVAITVEKSMKVLQSDDFNTIFIDPISLGLDDASNFILEIRKTLPEIVFVLYVDKAASERYRSDFYRGERKRFSHYYSLDKQIPATSFNDELDIVLGRCQIWLKLRMSQANIDRLRLEADRLVESEAENDSIPLLKEIRDLLSKVAPAIEDNREKNNVQKKSVFLSHRFAEKDYVNGLCELLEQNGFKVITGRSANTYISKFILDKIQKCEYFLCLMTRDQGKIDGTFTTSPWLLEEKGAALAFGKNIVLMVEEGVTDIGGLQGDWQKIHFGSKGFLNAALEAAKQLKSYSGDE